MYQAFLGEFSSALTAPRWLNDSSEVTEILSEIRGSSLYSKIWIPLSEIEDDELVRMEVVIDGPETEEPEPGFAINLKGPFLASVKAGLINNHALTLVANDIVGVSPSMIAGALQMTVGEPELYANQALRQYIVMRIYIHSLLMTDAK